MSDPSGRVSEITPVESPSTQSSMDASNFDLFQSTAIPPVHNCTHRRWVHGIPNGVNGGSWSHCCSFNVQNGDITSLQSARLPVVDGFSALSPLSSIGSFLEVVAVT